ncbi:hypothetical protein RintRC_2064 [Richelia intracellularis]|nr:hypothetical protein RintRC_2064 [Richelia intracellularis]
MVLANATPGSNPQEQKITNSRVISILAIAFFSAIGFR